MGTEKKNTKKIEREKGMEAHYCRKEFQRKVV
jgi:hypothetical protein